MKKVLTILTLPIIFFTLSCSISTKNLKDREPGFFFERKSIDYINYQNYQVLIPKKVDVNEKVTIKIKPENGRKIKKEITQDEYFSIQEILKSNNKLTDENKKTIQDILNLNSEDI